VLLDILYWHALTTREVPMPRLPYVSREELDDAGKRAWDAFAEPRRGRVENNPRLMLNSPRAAAHVFAFNTYLRFEAGIPEKAIAIATVVAGAVNRSDYVLAWHIPAAAKKGVSPASIDAITSGGPLDAVPADEAVVIRYAREVLGGDVSDEAWDAAHALLGPRVLLDLTFVIGQYTLMHLVGSAFRVSRDEDWEPLLV
jgi:4-carboxymuconolactone decarboxylase